VANGADILRLHDASALQALRVAGAIAAGRAGAAATATPGGEVA
jgi:hypothetical protein